MYRRLAIEQPAPRSTVVTEVTPSPTIMKDSLAMSDEDDSDDGPDSEIERITNVRNDDDDEISRPVTPRNDEHVRSPFSQLFTSQPPPKVSAGNGATTNKSDSDDDDDFIAMLKRK
jgi:hypothetical protein